MANDGERGGEEGGPGWWSPEELAAYLRVPVSTVYGWRAKGKGPTGHRFGRHVRYSREEVDRWVLAQRDGHADSPRSHDLAAAAEAEAEEGDDG